MTLAILNRLYSKFPEPDDIEGLRYVLKTLFEIGTDKEESKYLVHLSDAIRWLRDEGFIKYQSENAGDFRHVTLTLKGMGALNLAPSSLSQRVSLIQRIRAALQDGAANLTAETAKDLVEELFKARLWWRIDANALLTG